MVNSAREFAAAVVATELEQDNIIQHAAGVSGLGINIEGAPSIEAIDAAIEALTASREVRKLAHLVLSEGE